MTVTFWINQPSILLNNKYVGEIWPSEDLSRAGKYNAITRMLIILTFMGYMLKRDKQILCVGMILILCVVFLFKWQDKEGFFSNEMVYDTLKNNFQQPTEDNPMSNVMCGDNPNRKPAAPAYLPVVEKEINDKAKKMISKNLDETEEKIFKDLGENMNFEHSMRSWYSTANTQIPNNQREFIDYCYNDMSKHKEEVMNTFDNLRDT